VAGEGVGPLRGVIHDPLGGYDHGYPERIVDHAAERTDALARHAALPKN
jgi:hypothetical protein